ncbi:hypothetical protein OE88DRAFT_1666249 [Heliocybe sulcata]|uniref:Uncharacterized protein n=1 Tax=Heliocybe sulcata TaxID=5364 RepID=A0A5C3MPY8_9AGAM|nr:hypothetical protein OE88DRAFT_1666249 [Heliocybe sulcata]
MGRCKAPNSRSIPVLAAFPVSTFHDAPWNAINTHGLSMATVSPILTNDVEALPPTVLVVTSEAEAEVKSASEHHSDEESPDLTPAGPITKRLATVLCLLAMGAPSVERIAEHAGADEDSWREFKKTLFDRIANVNVVSSLILATTAAFLTTDPPTQFARWDRQMPYVTLLAAFCLGYIGAGSGVFLLFVLADVQGTSLKDLMRTPWKFWLAMLLLAMPVLFVGMAGGTAIIALTGAIWLGDSVAAKVVLTTTLSLTVSVVSSFLIVVS